MYPPAKVQCSSDTKRTFASDSKSIRRISMMCQYGERTVFALQLTPMPKPSARGDGSRRVTKDQDHPVDPGKLLGWHGGVERGTEIHSNCVISARDTIFRYLNVCLHSTVSNARRVP